MAPFGLILSSRGCGLRGPLGVQVEKAQAKTRGWRWPYASPAQNPVAPTIHQELFGVHHPKVMAEKLANFIDVLDTSSSSKHDQ
jgi:hypothetical protein